MAQSVSLIITLAVIGALGLLRGEASLVRHDEAATASQDAGANQLTADQQEVVRVLREIAIAHFKKDVATFGRFTAEEFVHLDADGALTNRQDWLRILEDEPQRLATPPEPLDAPLRLTPGTLIRVVGSTAVVVTMPTSVIEEQSARMVTVLVKRDAGWQQLLVNRQVTQRQSAK